jgi:hypothetical protein
MGTHILSCEWDVHPSPLFFPSAGGIVLGDLERSRWRAGLRLFQQEGALVTSRLQRGRGVKEDAIVVE